MCLSFDASAEPGKRIIEDSVKIAGEPLQKDKVSLLTKSRVGTSRKSFKFQKGND